MTTTLLNINRLSATRLNDISWLNDPNNWFGKLLKLPKWQQYVLLLAISGGSLILPITDYIHLQQVQANLEQQLLQQRRELQRQQQRLRSLRQQSNAVFLAPERAEKLTGFTQQMNSLLKNRLQVKHNQWEFHQFPLLSLQVQGNFTNLSQFLTALLTQYPALNVVSVHIERADQEADFSIQSEMILQFKDK
ncbi:hypothetical protein CFY87_05680 [Actinobacillus seminis]|uniref:Competence C protein n=1 Tax=Actinobacillus seminis TaxID=722 RepID=A0A263HCK9_9PAST|nr:hypothetical protein [Actinobacillus seminis]OZN25194.1 hypothetical protein CFY87_05680 [Actinobacillus seminis]SUU34038.1 competence C protein [Actinobacillus seminis]